MEIVEACFTQESLDKLNEEIKSKKTSTSPQAWNSYNGVWNIDSHITKLDDRLYFRKTAGGIEVSILDKDDRLGDRIRVGFISLKTKFDRYREESDWYGKRVKIYKLDKVNVHIDEKLGNMTIDDIIKEHNERMSVAEIEKRKEIEGLKVKLNTLDDELVKRIHYALSGRDGKLYESVTEITKERGI